MARYKFKNADFYQKRTRKGGKIDTKCEICNKSIKPNGEYYETTLTDGDRSLFELSEMDFDVLMAIDEVRFCSLKCIKRQLANYTDKTIQDYISKANENMKKLSQEEYEECYMFLYK